MEYGREALPQVEGANVAWFTNRGQVTGKDFPWKKFKAFESAIAEAFGDKVAARRCYRSEVETELPKYRAVLTIVVDIEPEDGQLAKILFREHQTTSGVIFVSCPADKLDEVNAMSSYGKSRFVAVDVNSPDFAEIIKNALAEAVERNAHIELPEAPRGKVDAVTVSSIWGVEPPSALVSIR